ncbi:MAG: hypothetical protein DHS20C12_00640 [Pseudohongiella sp.]|nr:MAG: hypothetical protein DHS20C12_00640 [Pseudohongiella sp.]
MNTSHSPNINTVEPLRMPSEVAAAQAPRPSNKGSDKSFDSVYQDESTSLGAESSNKSPIINELDQSPANEKPGPNSQEGEVLEAGGQMPTLTHGMQEHIIGDDAEASPLLPVVESANDDRNFETEALHGIGIAFPAAVAQAKVGEMLPPSGKELPLESELSEQELLLGRSEDELGRQSLSTREDSRIRSSEHDEGIRAIDRLKLLGHNVLRVEPSSGETNLEFNLGKATADLQTDFLSLMPARPQNESAAMVSVGNVSTSTIAVTSAADAGVLQKLTAIAESTANTDVSAGARANSLDLSTALGDKVHWMRNAKIPTAELHLHPAELGSIEIKIVTEDQQTRVSFVASSASARDIIEESMPKLRDLLADSGLELDQSDTSHRERGDDSSQEDQRALTDSKSIDGEVSREIPVDQFPSQNGRIDHYV